MTTDIKDHAQVETRLWDEIARHNTGMLGLMGPEAHHFQPMTAFVDREGRRIWFFTRSDTDLARQVALEGGAQAAMFVAMAPNFQACVGGRLAIDNDRARIDQYWNAVVAAWYPQGKDDPALTLVRMDCDDAAVWISEAGPARFVWEIAKANATNTTPDLGGRAEIRFH